MRIFLIIGLIGILPQAGWSKLKVMTTTTNLYSIVKMIGGEEVDVESLCKGVQDPHFLEAKPSYTFKLSRADLLVNIGADLEVGWLPLVVRGSRNPDMRVGKSKRLEAAHFVKKIEVIEGELSRSDGDVHPEGNPHFMLSPVESLKVAKAVKEKLIQLSPEKKEYFENNFKWLEKKITAKLLEWQNKIPAGVKVISYHKTLSYFFRDFKINNVAVLEPKPGVPPTAGHILNIIKLAKSQKIKKIIVENYFDETIAKRVQQDVPGLKVEVVPVAVFGHSGVDDIVQLYDYIVNKVAL